MTTRPCRGAVAVAWVLLEYYVRLRAHTRPHDAWFFWPWSGAALVQATFIVIP